MKIFAERQRRNVMRMAGLYLGGRVAAHAGCANHSAHSDAAARCAWRNQSGMRTGGRSLSLLLLLARPRSSKLAWCRASAKSKHGAKLATFDRALAAVHPDVAVLG